MGFTRYGKRLPELDDLSAEDLVGRLSEYLMHSGFADDWQAGEFSLDELRRAVLQALVSQAVIPLEELERMLAEAEDSHGRRAQELVDRMIRRMVEAGYLSLDHAEGPVPPDLRGVPGESRFELTERGLDLLGFRALRDTLRGVGGTFGAHDTTRLATGVEASEAPRRYAFGDALNLDPAATVLSAVRRHGARVPIELDESDLHVRQAELRVSSATVLMLDCSHSMILYGEDRFTPAKRVALALAHLVRTRYPGDELSLVLFHDSAEEVPLVRLPRVAIGPWHTNTAAGLRLARRVLARSRRELRTIVMITDGKPSALTLPDGRLYRNSFGLDPLILKATFDEVAACRRSNIGIHTFMLARDRALIGFVKQVTEIARGRAYFTTPMTLGRYVTLDYLNRKADTLN